MTPRPLLLAFVALLLVPCGLFGPARAQAPTAVSPAVEAPVAETPVAETADVACARGVSALPALQASPDYAHIAAEAARVPNGVGRLYRLHRDGVPDSWLFGTMHMADPRVLDMPDAAEAALEGSSRVVIETTDMLNEMKVAGALLLRSDLTGLGSRTLADILSPADLAAVKRGLQAHGIPFAAVQRLQPWFIAIGLGTPPCETARKAAGESVLDIAIARRAAGEGKTVLGLESGEEQLEAIASMPMDAQADNLIATLDMADDLPNIYETMIDLYLDGRIAAVGPVLEAVAATNGGGAETAAGFAAFEERVIDDRNVRMAERLRPILKAGDVFVAVGALHLPGEKGLVEALRRDAWTVTRVD